MLPNIYVEEFKYLGVIWDSSLTFKKHKKQVYCPEVQCWTLPPHLKLTVNQSCRDISECHDFTWYFVLYIILVSGKHNWPKSSYSRSLYGQALKVLDRKPRQHHHCIILDKHRMLSLDSLIKFSDIRLVHKIINTSAPPSLKNIVLPHSDLMNWASRSASRGNCSVPKLYSAFVQTSFSYKAIK